MYDRIKSEQFQTKVDGIEMIYNRLYAGQSNVNIDDSEVLKKLEEGHAFIKYGRKGKPKTRLVYFSQEDQKIYWRSKTNVNENPRFLKIEDVTIFCFLYLKMLYYR